jgi:chromosome segregation ATPase
MKEYEAELQASQKEIGRLKIFMSELSSNNADLENEYKNVIENMNELKEALGNNHGHTNEIISYDNSIWRR